MIRRSPRLPALFAAVLVALPAAANPDLERAERLIGDLEYPDAAKALDAAWKRRGNGRATVLRILELQGVVLGAMNQGPKAKKAFELLLTIAPGHKLSGEHSPRVMTPFYEAKAAVAERGTLVAEPSALLSNGRVKSLRVELKSDPLRLVKAVRFHVRADGASAVQVDAPLEAGTAHLTTDAERVEWWAELVGEQEMVLQQLGSESSPRIDGPPDAPKAVALAPTRAPSEPMVVHSPGPSGVRTAGYVSFGVAALAGAVGGWFGLESSRARSAIANAPTDAAGRVVGMTQREAHALDQQARSNAVLANVLWGGAAAAAVTGAVLWLVGGEPAQAHHDVER